LTSRRDVFRIFSLCAGVLAGLPRLLQAGKLALGLDKAEKLKKVGGSALLKIKDRELLFIRDAEDSIHVLDPTCTHKKCTVEYHDEAKKLICPCHGSTYDLEGKVLKGPAEKPLKAFEAKLSEDKIIFSLD